MTLGDSGPHRTDVFGDLDLAGSNEVNAASVPEVLFVDDLPRKRIFNLDFIDSADMSLVADAILSRVEPQLPGQLPVVVTPNVDIVVQMNQRPDSVETGVLLAAQYCLPDGQPIVSASRLLNRPLATRLAGRLLFSELWPRMAEENVPVTLVASSDEVKEGLLNQHPKADVLVAPFFDADDSETIEQLALSIVDRSRRSGAQFVLSGIGFPKDLLLADGVLRHWPSEAGRCPTTMGLGASFAFHLGLADKAPKWMQTVGLEWFHRFLQEPRRLFHRYFVRDARFIPLVLNEWRSSQEPQGVVDND